MVFVLIQKRQSRLEVTEAQRVVAGKPQESLLLQAIAHADPDLQMPPRVERLPDSVIADFKRWIERGAVDPRDQTHTASSTEVVAAEFWAYRRPLSPPIPAVDRSDALWCRSEIDRFVVAKLKQHDLRPSADAPARDTVAAVAF